MPYVRVIFTLLALCAALPVAAQNYPAKTVRLVSPFPPGGSVDVVGRILAAKLTEHLGQQVIVDN
ncbi:MAG TPA: tripartite tricarboxylate transporter substrate binding protein, partial [Burkholderiales bacterium]|nr:tripartite tricarboxylate transporter substrate binding protein [Burkholderiales bacterium]